MDKNKNKKNLNGKSTFYLIYVIAAFFSFFLSWKIGLTVLLLGFAIIVFMQRANIIMIMGLSQYSKKNYVKALKLLRAAHMSGAATMNNSYNYAYFLLREGRPDEARTAINYALRNPRITEAETYRGKEILSMIYYRQGDYSKATEIMQSVFDNFVSTNVYGTLGYYKILLKAEDAESFALEAYEYNKTDKVILDNLVQLYYEKGEFEKAKKFSDEATSAEAKGIETFYHAGLVEKALGNKEAAIENFKKALSFTPSFLTTVKTEEIERELAILQNE